MTDMCDRPWMARIGASRRRGAVVAGLAVAFLVAVMPALADMPETGANPGVTLTVTPDDLLSVGQAVTVTGTGFPANQGGVIRQCGGSISAPQCDASVAGTFVTTATGEIPATSVAVKRLIDTGTTTFNCGVQACALVATAGDRTSQHHISILGAGTIVPSSTTTSTSTTSPSVTSTSTIPTTTVPLSTTTIPSATTIPTPTTTLVPPPVPTPVCDLLQTLLETFPFLRGALDAVLTLLGCSPTG